MTNKRTIKNKQWEKDRRERLNNCFDKLASHLPNYDSTTPFSKIEILQKAIMLVEDLQKKIKNLMIGHTNIISKTQNELEEGFRLLLIRNNILLNLLKKAGITPPEFVAPKFFSYVIAQHQINGNLDVNDDHSSKKELKSDQSSTNEKSLNSNLTHLDDNDKKENMSIGSKKSIEQTDKDKTEKAISSVNATTFHTSSITTGVLIPAGNIVRLPSQSSIILLNKIDTSTLAVKNKKIKSKNVPGKIRIPALRSKILPKPKRVRRKKIDIEMERKEKEKQKELVSKIADDEKQEIKTDHNLNNKITVDKSVENKVEVPKCDEQKPVEEEQQKETTLDKLDIEKSQDEPEQSLPETELPNEILQSLDVSQSETDNPHHHHHHHESLSPTAAFLLSFPVVSLAASRLTDVDPTDSNQLVDLPQPSKSIESQTCTGSSSMLDNISSLFSCKEFDGTQQMPFDNGIGKRDQHKSTIPDLSFDFQLKPLLNSKTYSTSSINSTIVTSEVKSGPSKSSNMFFEPIAPKSCTGSFHSDAVFSRPGLNTNLTACSVSGISSQCDTSFSFSLTTATDIKPTLSSSNSSTDRVYGFYDSLSAIGSSYKNSSYSMMEPKLELGPPVSVASAKNLNKSTGLYSGRLPMTSNISTNAIETMEFLPQTPFTFSLTTSVSSQPTNSSDLLAKTTKVTNSLDTFLSTPAVIPSPMNSKYNPFSFDNIHSTSTATGSCSIPYVSTADTSGFSFALTSVTDKTSVKNSLSQTSGSSFPTFPINYNMLPPEPSTKFKQPPPPPPHPPSFTGIIPSFNNSTDLHLTPRNVQPPSHLDFNICTTSTTATTAYPSLTNLDSKKVEPYFSHPSISVVSADEHFPWSPNKMLDSSALPTLHGDLALNTISIGSSSSGGGGGAVGHCDKRHHKRIKFSAKNNAANDYMYSSTGGQHQTSGNFLSVSNLVSETKKSDSHHRQKIGKLNKSFHDNLPTLPSCSVEGYPFGASSYNNEFLPSASVSRLHNNYSTESLISQTSKKYSSMTGMSTNSTDYYNPESTSTNFLYPNPSNTDYGNDSNYSYYNSNYLMPNAVPTESDYSSMSSMFLPDSFTPSNTTKSNQHQHQHRSSNRSYSSAQKKLFSQDHMYPPPPPPPHICSTSSHVHDLSAQSVSNNSSSSYHFVPPPPPPPVPVVPPPPPLPITNDDFLSSNTSNSIINPVFSGNYKNVYFHGSSMSSENFSVGNTNGVQSGVSSSTASASNLVTNFNLSTILS